MNYYDAEEFWDRTLKSRPDLTGVGHGAYGPNYNRFLYRAKVRALMIALKRTDLSIEGRTILDVGCGFGFFTDILKRLGCNSYTGIDLAPIAIRRATESHPEYAFHTIDISDESCSKISALGTFDVVCCFDVIYHIVDPARFKRAVDNLWSCVSPGGWLLLSDSFWKRDLVPGGSLEPHPGSVPHVCFHRMAAYEETLFSFKDFQQVDVIPMYFLFNRPIIGTRFPWNRPRLSWHLRYRFHERGAVLKTMYVLDSILRLVPWNPSLKLLVARKRAD